MRAIGLMRELQVDALSDLPSIHDLMGRLDPLLVEPVVEYLKNGEEVVDVMEYCPDPLDHTVGISGGSSLVTDGVYVWRYDLYYYVLRYRISLDDEFVQHALKNEKFVFRDVWCMMAWNDFFDACGESDSDDEDD